MQKEVEGSSWLVCEKTASLSQQHGLMGLFLFLLSVNRKVLEIRLLVRKYVFLSLSPLLREKKLPSHLMYPSSSSWSSGYFRSNPVFHLNPRIGYAVHTLDPLFCRIWSSTSNLPRGKSYSISKMHLTLSQHIQHLLLHSILALFAFPLVSFFHNSLPLIKSLAVLVLFNCRSSTSP